MKRIRIDLDDAMHARLTAWAKAYGADPEDERRSSLKAIAGLWKDRRDLPTADAYVRRLRRDTRSKSLRPR